VKLWVLSDWHMEQRVVFDPPRPDFDAPVVAGDVSKALQAPHRAQRGDPARLELVLQI
jgi:hypothetical protein